MVPANTERGKNKRCEDGFEIFFSRPMGPKGTSHIVIRSEKLKAFEEFKPYGEITVPVKSGKHVKGFYIKTIIKGIELLQNTAEETNGK